MLNPKKELLDTWPSIRDEAVEVGKNISAHFFHTIANVFISILEISPTINMYQLYGWYNLRSLDMSGNTFETFNQPYCMQVQSKSTAFKTSI